MDDILFQTPDNPVPNEGKRHVAGHFTAYDGKSLRYAIFKCQAPVARGTIVLLHGRNECIEKYYETISDFTRAGFWVATFDWRGQGASERLIPDHSAGYVRRFSDYVRDLETFIKDIVLPDTRLPFSLVAHSTGGLVALAAAPALAGRIDRMVLSAPFLALSGTTAGEKGVYWLARIACLFGQGKRILGPNRNSPVFQGNRLTHDERRFRRNRAIFEAAPLLKPSSPTAKWLKETIATMRRVRRRSYLDTIAIPTIVLAAGADEIVPFSALESLSHSFRAGRVIPIDRARHELFQEKDIFREQAVAAALAFIAPPDRQTADDPNVTGAQASSSA